MNEIYENRNFYKPIATPYDFEVALNPKLQNTNFSYDFNAFLNENNQIDDSIKHEINASDVSLLTGNIRYKDSPDAKGEPEVKQMENLDEEKKLVMRDKGEWQVSTNYGAGYLRNRSWKGLEPKLGETEPQLAVEGRKGIAQGYENEK